MRSNPVAKYAAQFNRAATHKDRKKASKRVRGHKYNHADAGAGQVK